MMKTWSRAFALVLACMAAAPAVLGAQSDVLDSLRVTNGTFLGTTTITGSVSGPTVSGTLLRVQSGSPQSDRFAVDSGGGVVGKGSLGIGIIPATGAGDRMMWYPFRSTFRAGGVSGDQWDDANLGFYSAAFGNNVTAKGNYSFVTGRESQTQQQYGVAMGYTATSNGQGAVSIGYFTTADANHSVAIGYRASTNGKSGAIVLADQSAPDSLEASANNQFSLRAAGGIRLYTNNTRTTGVTMAAGGSSWIVVSDRNRKESFLAVDGEDVLARIRSIPVTTWRYRDEEDRTTRHIGPMAQDWHRAFGFSGDPLTINMSDLDGVNFAAVKALEARTAELAERAAEVERLNAEVAALRAENTDILARLARIEALLDQ